MFNEFHNRIKEYFELIKFEHTLFALPFALSGMLLAAKGFPSAQTVFLVILAMVSGRTMAMALNRVIDADIDALNPRTAQRAIPAGRIKRRSALLLAILSLAVMVGAVIPLPSICLNLLPLAVGVLVLYSYTKRFTRFSHFVLGSALGAGAAGGWLAVSGEITAPVVLWGLAVMFWVAGFDVVYAIQDIEFDRVHKLFSIPAVLGVDKSLVLARYFHLTTMILLVLMGFLINAGVSYLLALIFAALMLKYEHSIITGNDLIKLNTAFFDINAYVSTGLFLFILIGKFFHL